MRWVLTLALLLVACDGATTDPADDDSGAVSMDASTDGTDSGTPMGLDGALLADAGPMAMRDAGGSPCEYPPGAVEPMTLGEPLWPYRWPTALHADGRDFPLDLSEVVCTADPNIDWSPFDVLVFVSIPGW